MKFKKILIPASGLEKEPITNWYLILTDMSDVMKYLEIDAKLFAEALLSIPKQINESHISGNRARVINTMMQNAIESTPEGQQIWPSNVLANFVQKKFRSMCKVLEYGELQVNQGGGYCQHDSFIRQWNATVVEEIERNGCYFPEYDDDVAIMSDLLFLENAERIDVSFERNIHNIVGYDYNTWNTMGLIKNTITQLELRDPEWVVKMIANAKTIAIQTQLINDIQLEKFMLIFAQLEGKIIYISTSAADELKAHTLFNTCDVRHKITFI